MTKNIKSHIVSLAAAIALLVAASPALAQTHARDTGTHTTSVPRASAHPAASHAPPAHTATSHASPSDVADGVVNIETATAEQLQLLPGIGPSKAEAIITYRRAHPFQRVEDILRVRGIGRATFRRLRAMITVSGATTMTTDVRAGRAAAASPASSPTASEPSDD